MVPSNVLLLINALHIRGQTGVLCDLGMRREHPVLLSIPGGGQGGGGTEFHRIILHISDSSQPLPLSDQSTTSYYYTL